MVLIPRTGRVMTIVALLMLLTATGCRPAPDMRDERLAQFAEQSMARQAEQNAYIAKQSQALIEENQTLAEASKELVAKDAQARQELLRAQTVLNEQLNERSAVIDVGRDQLEQERRQIAQQRHRDPVVANAIQTVGLLIACLLPLVVCVLVIWRMGHKEPEDAVLGELLASELVSDQPRLLSGPSLRPALEHRSSQDQVGDTQPNQPAESELPF